VGARRKGRRRAVLEFFRTEHGDDEIDKERGGDEADEEVFHGGGGDDRRTEKRECGSAEFFAEGAVDGAEREEGDVGGEEEEVLLGHVDTISQNGVRA
jgi:hypothetical protein